MEIIYRTFDGKEFDNEADACFHESVVLGGIKMWNRDGKEVNETEKAFVVYLANEAASDGFFALAEAQGDTNIHGLTRGMDYGLFFWDEWNEEYRYLDQEEQTAIAAAVTYLNSRKDKEDDE